MTPTEELFTAIREGRADHVRTMLAAQPVLLQSRDARGSTPLVLATYLGNLDVTKALVDAGADLDARDAAGNSPLMGVAFKGDAAVADYLIAQGARVDTRNFTGGTALTFAAMFNRTAMVDLLLAAGADPAVRDEKNLSPADHARSQGHGALADRLTARP